jgi:hypothetical protein
LRIELKSGLAGKDFYARIYQDSVTDQAEWLHKGAFEKAESVDKFLRGIGKRPGVLAELGAGTGAVISECRRRNLADHYLAIDYSQNAIDYISANVEGVEAYQADITDPMFSLDRSVDVVVVTHVLEHLEDPKGFLESVRSKISAKDVVLEVPLEDLPLCKLKALVKDRRNNSAGHVQFFTAHSFDQLVENSGYEIIARRAYLPVSNLEEIRGIARRDGLPSWRVPVMWLMRSAAPRLLGPLWRRLNYAHYALLCRPK